MNRLVIGIILLLVMLAMGIGLTAVFTRLHEPLSETLDAASAAALREDWENATALARRASADWKKYRNFTAAVADHEPLEQMDVLFSRLEVLGWLQNAEEFAADCAELSRLAAAMAHSQGIQWWNLL